MEEPALRPNSIALTTISQRNQEKNVQNSTSRAVVQYRPSAKSSMRTLVERRGQGTDKAPVADFANRESPCRCWRRLT